MIQNNSAVDLFDIFFSASKKGGSSPSWKHRQEDYEIAPTIGSNVWDVKTLVGFFWIQCRFNGNTSTFTGKI